MLTKSLHIHIEGMVQGIGFRPFVYRLAHRYSLRGYVKNTGSGVDIFASGEAENIRLFLDSLQNRSPENALIENITVTETDKENKYSGFTIEKSRDKTDKTILISPDLPLCSDCLAEMRDPANRRCGYPLISCTACGPRYSIMYKLPYDRENTTMQNIRLCGNCRKEYLKENDRRLHAQTIGCYSCYEVSDRNNCPVSHHYEYVRYLLDDQVISIKDTGGYHLVCNALSKKAVAKLRKIKRRENKPFAVCFRSVEMAKDYCKISEWEKKTLLSLPRPIVLLDKSGKKSLAENVCRDSGKIGAMLPSTGLQYLLCDFPLVMTSANRSGDSIIYDDRKMLEWIENEPLIRDVLTHKREILSPLDDSIFLPDGRDNILIRRARGIVPQPVYLKEAPEDECFAAGGDLKSAFALRKGRTVYMSQFFGDLEDLDSAAEYSAAKERMEALFDIRPERGVCDMHPGYISAEQTKKAYAETDKVQHHHAHALSVMAEYGLKRSLAVILDGTGYGTDGTVWGGEILFCEGSKFRRCAHLKTVSLSSGNEGAKNAKMLSYAYLYAAGIESDEENYRVMKTRIELDINICGSSSAGRLFDAVSSLLGICDYNSYEGECASKLEAAAALGSRCDLLKARILTENETYIVDTPGLIADIYKIREDFPREDIALSFHHSLAAALAGLCKALTRKYSINTLVLSGGCFQNKLLLDFFRNYAEGAEIYINRKVPVNDGGLALGQIYYDILKK